MTIEEAKLVLHPDTTLMALEEVEYYGGFNGAETRIKAVEEACIMACNAIEELQAYKQAEQDGTLHISPCADGTPIWYVADKEIADMFEIDRIQSDFYQHGFTEYRLEQFKKDWFLTKEEAEKALEGMK